MGLLLFKERDANDKSPYRKNEFHVGLSTRSGASNKSSSHATSDARTNTRSPIRRDIYRRERRRSRQIPHPDSAATESFIEWLLPTTSARSRAVMDYMMHQDAFNNIESPRTGNNHTDQVVTAHDAPRATRQEMNGLEFSGARADPRNVDNADRVSPIPRTYTPARQDPETIDIAQHFEVMRARARAYTANSWPSSPERVASPDTQQAILQQIENQSDLARYSRQFANETDHPVAAPRMRISRSDGLGDRRRSPSNEGDRLSDAEENWNSLMATIPPVDDNLPGTTSSFASDSASSILSRSRPRSSLTNTSVGSRAASADAAALRILQCPEANDPSQPNSQRLFGSTSSLAPPRIRSASMSGAGRSWPISEPPTNIELEEIPFSLVPEGVHHGLDNLDLMEMLNNGVEVPAEMWAAVGITPHLGLRAGTGRLRRRSERL